MPFAGFLKHYENVVELRRECWSLGIDLCRLQRLFGDFGLKVSLGYTAADLLLLTQRLSRKVQMLNLGWGHQEFQGQSHCGRQTCKPSKALETTLRSLESLLQRMSITAKTFESSNDIDLTRTLREYTTILGDHVKELSKWESTGPTEARSLAKDAGLFRDCSLYRVGSPGGGPGLRTYLRDKDLSNPVLRACYLSANAYLEITSIDIVSDLITLSTIEQPPNFHFLIFDLARQLHDEARHAALLASCVEHLGLQVGIVPVSLHTWRCYQMFDSLAERIAVQQVLQEGIGLDISAATVKRMSDWGDLRTSTIFAQITADELQHVALGVKWLGKLQAKPLTDLLCELKKVLMCEGALPEVPVEVELQKLAGLPHEWICAEAARRGTLKISELHEMSEAFDWVKPKERVKRVEN